MRFKQDYWHKIIIEGTMNQIKSILLKWVTILPKISSECSLQNIKNIPPKENKNNLIEILQSSPFLYVHHVIKNFLMKEILKINYNNNIRDHNNILNKNEYDSPDKLGHPMISLYMKMYNNQYSNSFQTINGLLAYLKILNYVY